MRASRSRGRDPVGPGAAAAAARGRFVRGAHPGALGRRVLVLGGTSEIALAIVAELQRLAPREVALVGRDAERLARASAQLAQAGVSGAIALTLDARDVAA